MRDLTAKNMPDSCSMRATQICMVPTYLYPSNIGTSSVNTFSLLLYIAHHGDILILFEAILAIA